MFDPAKSKAAQAEKAMKKRILQDLTDWATSIVPVDIREGLMIDVKEVQCGDPGCSPIDTIFTLIWKEGGRGMFAMPLSPEEIDPDILVKNFPFDEVLTKWSKGEKARWPPRPQLRFELGERVECRVGPHPVKGWAAGRVLKLLYRESNWPPNMVAPYQIALHDGRLIFAPADNDNVIRKRGPPNEGDAPSPEFHLVFGDDYEEGDEDEFDDIFEDQEGVTMTHDDDDDDDGEEDEGGEKAAVEEEEGNGDDVTNGDESKKNKEVKAKADEAAAESESR